ncbi:MAG: RNA polymerase sigma factor [Gammaproteobacteria bacterium]|nr:RNA polymerase sigma factor [Gammaproteobacteria bacterium]
MDSGTSRSRLEAIYFECRAALKSVIRRYLRRPEDVDDIAQEVYVRVLEADGKSPILDPRAYFFVTARNLALKHLALHANKITGQLEDFGLSEVMDEKTALDAQYEVHEQLSIFFEAVQALPPQCRRVLILKKVYGLSHEEIAERLNIAISTANQHLAKGLARCTVYLQERGYLGGTMDGRGGVRKDGKS